MEIWKDIRGFEGYYEISNTGKVRAKERYVRNRYGLCFKHRLHEINILISEGYYYVNLSKECKRKQPKLHRLLAEAFIPNPDNLPCVNHINGNKLNNSLDNLEWCTVKHNNEHAYKMGLRTVSEKTRKQITELGHKYGKINGKKAGYKNIIFAQQASRKQIVIFKDDFYKEFESETEACKFLNVHRGSVGRAARNSQYKIKGYSAKYSA